MRQVAASLATLLDMTPCAVAVSGLAHRKLLWFILKEFSTNNRSGFSGGLQERR